MLYAFARLGHRPPIKLMQACEARIVKYLALGETLSPADIAQSVWSFGR